MIFTFLVALWKSYDNLGFIKKFLIILSFLKQYYFMWWKNPQVSVRLKKIYILNENPKKYLQEIYNSLIESDINPLNGISSSNNRITFKPGLSKITFEINGNSGLSPDGTKNLYLETGDFIIYPFRNIESLSSTKIDFLKISDLILNNIKSERINEIIQLEIIFDKLKPELKKINFLHENCEVICNGKNIQINNCTGKEYEILIKAIILKWYKEFIK